MTELKYKFTFDILFKLLFVKYPNLLQRLIAAILGVTVNDLKEFTITNPEIPPEAVGDKFCRLDISMIVNGQLVNLEVQVLSDFLDKTCYPVNFNIRADFVKLDLMAA